MKYRTMSGCVTVTGPPASICALNFGTTDPFEASTLPNRTEIRRIRGLPPGQRRQIVIERLAVHLGKALGQAEHRDRFDRLVGRNHHHRFGAGGECRVCDVDRAEDVGLDALAPVPLQDRHMLQRSGVKHDVRLELVHQPHDAFAIADIRDPALDDRVVVPRRPAPPSPRSSAGSEFSTTSSLARRRRSPRVRRSPNRSNRRRR